MILTVTEFKENYLLDKAEEYFGDRNQVDKKMVTTVDETLIEKCLMQAEIQVQIDTNRNVLPKDSDQFKYAVAQYCLSQRVSSGLVKINSEDGTFVNTYYSNYIKIVKRLRRLNTHFYGITTAEMDEL